MMGRNDIVKFISPMNHCISPQWAVGFVTPFPPIRKPPEGVISFCSDSDLQLGQVVDDGSFILCLTSNTISCILQSALLHLYVYVANLL